MISKFTGEECKRLIKYHEDYNKINITKYPFNQGIYKSKLNYNVSLVFRDSETQWAFNKISGYLKSQYPLNVVDQIEFLYLHEFEKGMKFTKHIDKSRDCSWFIVVGASLNSEYTGGKLKLYEPDEITAVNTGELYTIEAERPHEVTEVTDGTRYSFVLFITKKELGIAKTLL